MSELSVLAALMLVHILSDFYFQPSTWVEERNLKHVKSRTLYFHVTVHGALSFCVFSFLSNYGWFNSLVYSCVIILTHFFIDLIKSHARKNTLNFVLDQFVHIIILILLWGVASGKLSEIIVMYQGVTYKHLTLIIAYLIILKPTSVVITKLLSPWTKDLKGDEDSLDAAGMMIGYLERLLILTFIVLNQFPAIGFLLATKSVFRFGDLSNAQGKKLTEYVMLGTLTSFTITILVGLIVTSIVSTLPIGK
ncbi:MAG: DUF3307 domain-containing protein [Paraglaciecola sp.]|nr:DUF3307 domain-containing protein [Paraglaciecola sp.]